MSYTRSFAALELVNRTFDLYTGGDRRPVFFNIDQTCPALRELDWNSAARCRSTSTG